MTGFRRIIGARAVGLSIVLGETSATARSNTGRRPGVVQRHLKISVILHDSPTFEYLFMSDTCTVHNFHGLLVLGILEQYRIRKLLLQLLVFALAVRYDDIDAVFL